MPKYRLITYGCQMNKSDSERVATLLDRMGLSETAHEADADLVLINSCSVRQTAEDRRGRGHEGDQEQDRHHDLQQELRCHLAFLSARRPS